MKKKKGFSFNDFKWRNHFIIKELAEELKKQFICLGEKLKKLTVPIEKN